MKPFFFVLRFLSRHYTGAKHVTSEDTGAKRLEGLNPQWFQFVGPFFILGPLPLLAEESFTLPTINKQDDQIVEISTNLKACCISCKIIDFFMSFDLKQR